MHSPFVYDLYMQLVRNPNPFGDFEELKKLRKQLGVNSEMIAVTDFGAGSKKLNSTYFSNVEACSNCAFDTDAKWELFASKIELFRKDRLAYQSFLDTIGYSSINSKINCNNWRMYLCGGGCVLTCEVPPVFAGCLMMCAASFC